MAGRQQTNLDIARLNSWHPDAVSDIFDAVADGWPLDRIAREVTDSTRGALVAFIEEPSRVETYRRARARAATKKVEEAENIADGCAADGTPDQNVARTEARDKLRVQHRQWTASRWDRATYGESRGPSVEVNIGGMFLDAMRKSTQPVDTQELPLLPDPEA